MINKQPCRLKDIKDVFHDTGLDFKSYSILEQGKIGAILNSKPLERRFIIEEVAGVMKYKVRMAEALSKLESSSLNLARVNDIITEVKKQINILDRLAKKAERYKKPQAELNAIELKIARREYQKVTDSLIAINEEYGTLKEREAVTGAEITGIENRTQTRRINLVSGRSAGWGSSCRGAKTAGPYSSIPAAPSDHMVAILLLPPSFHRGESKGAGRIRIDPKTPSLYYSTTPNSSVPRSPALSHDRSAPLGEIVQNIKNLGKFFLKR